MFVQTPLPKVVPAFARTTSERSSYLLLPAGLRLQRIERFERLARRQVVGMKRGERRKHGGERRVRRRGRRRPRRSGKQRQVLEAAWGGAVLGLELGEHELRPLDHGGRQA